MLSCCVGIGGGCRRDVWAWACEMVYAQADGGRAGICSGVPRRRAEVRVRRQAGIRDGVRMGRLGDGCRLARAFRVG